MKRFLASLFVAVILLLTIGLTACGTRYTVTFDGGGGVLVSGEETIEVRSGGKIKIDDEPKYSRDGYDFIGWDISLENIKDNIKPTAQWRLIEYNVTFNGKGGTLANNDTEEEQNVSIETPVVYPAYEKVGYEFSGWDKKIDHKAKTAELSAKWNPLTYTITFDVNGGDEQIIEPLTVTFDKSVSFPTPTRERFKFVGWRIGSVDGAVLNEGMIWNIPQNVTVYADWTQDEFVISYDLDGGTLSASTINKWKNGDNPIDLSKLTPVKKGCVFEKWCIRGKEDAVSSLSNFTEDVKLIAVYREIVYNVVFSPINKNGDGNLQVVLPEEKVFSVKYGEKLENIPKGNIKDPDEGKFLRWVIYINGKEKEITADTVFADELLGTAYSQGEELVIYPVFSRYWVGPF